MPRSAVVAAAVIGVLALVASTTFALVRSTQLRTSEQQVAQLRSQLAQATQDGGDDPGAAPSPEPSEPDPFGDGDDPFGDLFGDGREGMDDLFGPDAQQLAQCIEPAGPLGGRDIGDGPAEAQIEEIGELVSELRELEFETAPEPEFLDDAEIAERLQREIREDYEPEEAQLDARVLAALGAVPPGTDLVELQTDLLTTTVAGYYDPDNGELVVRADDGGNLSAVAQSTLAHELQHAVADQRLELPVDTTENSEEGDAALAALSLIEGDATLTQQQFSITGMSLREQLALNTDPSVAESQRRLAEVPYYLSQSLQFPYMAGLQFVCSRFLEGGWDAVDATYDQLPTTSVEILDPSRYGTPAVDPRDPGDLGGDWGRARTSTFGAADLLWLFGAPGDDPGQALDGAREQALAWTGGEIATWTADDDTAIGVALTQQQSGGPLCDALVTWYRRAFPDSSEAPTRSGERMVRESDVQTAVVWCEGDEVRLGIAPDLPSARALVS